MKALALKELRELRGVAAIGLAFYLVLVARMMGVKAFEWAPGMPQVQEFPAFGGGDFLSVYSLIAAVLAMAIGFRQSAWEASQGTFLFLLHRPMSRNRIFLTKLAAGTLVYLVCSSLPILVYAWWAATPGRHAAPFLWRWTMPAWTIMGILFLPYLGAFLSGIRPARWFGTRLLPLVGILLLTMLALTPGFLDLAHPSRTTLALGATACTALAATYVSLICHVGKTRDYA
jgi:hypothetical protein